MKRTGGYETSFKDYKICLTLMRVRFSENYLFSVTSRPMILHPFTPAKQLYTQVVFALAARGIGSTTTWSGHPSPELAASLFKWAAFSHVDGNGIRLWDAIAARQQSDSDVALAGPWAGHCTGMDWLPVWHHTTQ